MLPCLTLFLWILAKFTRNWRVQILCQIIHLSSLGSSATYSDLLSIVKYKLQLARVSWCPEAIFDYLYETKYREFQIAELPLCSRSQAKAVMSKLSQEDTQWQARHLLRDKNRVLPSQPVEAYRGLRRTIRSVSTTSVAIAMMYMSNIASFFAGGRKRVFFFFPLRQGICMYKALC